MSHADNWHSCGRALDDGNNTRGDVPDPPDHMPRSMSSRCALCGVDKSMRDLKDDPKGEHCSDCAKANAKKMAMPENRPGSAKSVDADAIEDGTDVEASDGDTDDDHDGDASTDHTEAAVEMDATEDSVAMWNSPGAAPPRMYASPPTQPNVGMGDKEGVDSDAGDSDELSESLSDDEMDAAVDNLPPRA